MKGLKKSQVFELCTVLNKYCGMCASSNYDIVTKKNTSQKIYYCGAVKSGMNKIEKLNKCWLEMNGYEQRKHKKENIY